MPTPKKGPRLASSPAHERLMLANMATSLFQHGRITTTLPKAKRLRPLAERLITLAKRGDLHNRRRVMRVIRNKSVVHKLFTEIAEQMEQREGGYTRIVKIAPRRGDAAPAAIIELVTEPVSPKLRKPSLRKLRPRTPSDCFPADRKGRESKRFPALCYARPLISSMREITNRLGIRWWRLLRLGEAA